MAGLKKNSTLKQKATLKASSGLKAQSGLKTKTTLKKSLTPKRQRKPQVSKLKKEADKYWSLATRYRFINKDGSVDCVTCGVKKDFKDIQCGHFMSRRFNATRFSEFNTAPQCVGCNLMRYGEQYKFGRWIDDMYGPGTAERLYGEARVPHQFKASELEEIISECKSQIEWYTK